MKPATFSALLALSSLSWAAAPTVLDGPRIQAVGSHYATVKSRTADAAGPASTLTAGVDATTTSIPVAECANFPSGAILSLEGKEHIGVTSRSAASGACTLTVRRPFDYDSLKGWTSTLTSVVITGGNTATINTPMAHYYSVGDPVRPLRMEAAANLTITTYTVATVPSSTSFTITCSGCTNGTYTAAGNQIQRAGTSHSSGAAVTRIDSDFRVCIATGSGGPYTAKEFASLDDGSALPTYRQSDNHYAYVVSLSAGTTYYAKTMSTPRTGTSTTNATPSSCSSPGSDTAVSSEFTITTDAEGSMTPTAPSTAGKTWSYTTESLTYSTDVSATDCSDAQTKINSTAAAADGALNYRIKIPAASNWACNLTLPKKTNAGSGKLVLMSDSGSCPASGTRVVPATHSAALPTLYTNTQTPVIDIAPEASYWFLRCLKLTANPATADFGGDFPLVRSLSGDGTDYDTSKDPNHIVLQHIWATCPEHNDGCKGFRIHGDYLIVKDSDIGPVYGAVDQGGIQVDGLDSQYIWIHNNKVQSVMSGYYQSDNGLATRDIWVENNYFYKPPSWNISGWQYQLNAVQGVASATAGSPTTINTTYESRVATNTPIAFSGATGSWAALNYTRWSVTENTLEISCTGGTCTATTSSVHGLSTGDRAAIGGGPGYTDCDGLNTQGASVSLTVTSTTTFTWANDEVFSTTGTPSTPCLGADLNILAPVFIATKTDNDTFTITKNSTGFGSLTGTVTISYPISRNVKNAFEFKNGIRAVVSGNTIQGSYPGGQSGQLTVMSVRGSDAADGIPLMQGASAQCFDCGITIHDVDITNNLLIDGCVFSNILGINPNGPVTPLERVRWKNNLALGVSVANGLCDSTPAVWSGSYDGVTLDHNTVMHVNGRVVTESYGAATKSSRVTLNANILASYTAPSNGDCSWGGMVTGQSCTNASWLSWTVTRNVFWGSKATTGSSEPWQYGRSHMSGSSAGIQADYEANFWPELVSETTWLGQRSISGCTNATPIVCTTTVAHGLTTGDQVWNDGDTGNTNANGRWYVRVLSSTTYELVGSIGNGTSAGTRSMTPFNGAVATVAAFALTTGSPFLAGTTFDPALKNSGNYGNTGAGDDGAGGPVGVNTTTLAAALSGDTSTPAVTPRYLGASKLSGASK